MESTACAPFADNGNVNASNFPNVGGNYNNGDNAGPFNANFNYSASNTNSNTGSRLSYITLQFFFETLGKSMQPQLLLKNHGRTNEPTPHRYGLGTPERAKEEDAVHKRRAT